MARESVMSTPIFDQLLREMAEMAQRAESHAAVPAPPASPEPETTPEPDPVRPAPRGRRHRAD
jgi:hypothetical protein